MQQPHHVNPPSSHRSKLPQTVSVSRMQAIDRAAIQGFGIPRLLLMEHAGVAVARAARAMVQPPGPILVCCGSGFNGGDGLAAARHLVAAGYSVGIVVTAARDALREEPETYARILESLGLSLSCVLEPAQVDTIALFVERAALLIDALLGIGVRGTVREPTARLIEMINQSGTPVLAVDIPSGLDGDSGEPRGCAVQATQTVTFGLTKAGCVTPHGRRYAGQVIVDTISFPPQLLKEP